MIKSLKFSHKILLAASLVVFAAFALFTLYNDYLQRNAIREDLESYLREMGDVTSSNIQNWLGGDRKSSRLPFEGRCSRPRPVRLERSALSGRPRRSVNAPTAPIRRQRMESYA